MTIPQTMKAAFIHRNGGTGEIQTGSLPTPVPGPTDVLVRMEASEVNHVDLFVRSGAYETFTPFPFIIGRDLVGTVVATGAGVQRFAVGDRVWSNSLGHDGRQGSFAEYAVVSTQRLYPLPSEVDKPAAAAATLHAAATAFIGLVREAKIAAGETLLVEGAGGGVGSAIVQMARFMGVRTIATASEADATWCRSCGADVVFDYRRVDLYDRVREAAPDGINVWWDNSGHNNFARGLPLMAFGGRVILMSGLKGAEPTLPVGAVYTKDITLHGFAISNASTSNLASAARLINRLFSEKRLQARIGATYTLDDAAKAHQAMESGTVRGRIVVVP